MAKSRPLPRPFLKWAGGKTQLLGEIERRFPQSFGTYFEPFLGGGAVFFHLRRLGLIERAVLSDINVELIVTWKVIRDDVESLIQKLKGHRNTPKHFLKVRKMNPWLMGKVALAARMIFLNKTCFNGLYRVNRSGGFNVPFAGRKNPLICDETNLREVSKALQGVELKHRSFEEVLKGTVPGDFVYMDPPYDPASKTANFTGYTAKGFKSEDQAALWEVFGGLGNRNVKALLSNSCTERIVKMYGGQVEVVKASRAINSKGAGRGKVKEVLVKNYLNERLK